MNLNSEFPTDWVLIRGLARGCFHWKNFTDELKAKFPYWRFHFVELAGNGYRFNEKTPSEINNAVDDLKRQIPDSLKSFGIISISLGGMLAVRWMQTDRRLRHLVLMNSSSTLSPFYHRLLLNNYPGILKTLITRSAEEQEKYILNATSNFEEVRAQHLKDNITFLKKHPVSGRNFIAQLRLAGQVRFELPKDSQCLILASVNDRLVSSSCSQKIANAWNKKCILHPTAGHDLTLDDGQWVIEQIEKWSTI